MYICVCKAVTDNQIIQAIDHGANTRKQVMKCTGAGGVCGKCASSLKDLLSERSAQQTNIRSA